MNKKFRQTIVVMVVIIATIMNGFGQTAVQASTQQTQTFVQESQPKAAKKKVSKIKVEYNKKAKIYNGEKCSKTFLKNKLHLRAYAVDKSGKKLNMSVKVKEQGEYLHASNGNITLTLVCDNKIKKIKLKAVPVKQVTVNKNNIKLTENKKLTKAMIKKTTFKVSWKDGKTEKNYKGAKCLDLGKRVKGKTFRVRFRIGNKIVTVKFPVKKETTPKPTPNPSPTPEPTPTPSVHTHVWKYVSKNKQEHERTCYCGKVETQKHTLGEWSYIKVASDVRYCSECNYLEIRKHEHTKEEPKDIQYSFSKSNDDGTHTLKGIYTCSICKQEVTVNKVEDCSYDISYEQSNEEDIHNLVKSCKICQHRIQEKGSCDYKDDWKYIDNNKEVRYCTQCNGEQTREHEHENEPNDLQYVCKESNNDGTHSLEGVYTCSICKQEVTVNKVEDCSYDVSYEQSNEEDIHNLVKSCKICQHQIQEKGSCDYKDDWKYINNGKEARYCTKCNGEQTREHEHENEPNDLQYVCKESNNDGTHTLEGVYTCSICEQEVTVNKVADCSYEVSYERTGVNDIHKIVKICSVCQYRTEEEGSCEPTGELKCRKVNSQIYEYYDCAQCGDWCQRSYHTEHKFGEWGYRDSREHIVYCICIEERKTETHNYVYDKEKQMVTCEGCHDTKPVINDHNHGKGTYRNMDLMQLVLNKEAYNELLDTGQQKNPIPNAESYCSRYDFLCRECGNTYCVYYDHSFENGVCTRKGYCGGIAEPNSIRSILEK